MANKKTSDYAALPGGIPNDTWLLDIANANVINYKGTSLEFKDYVNAGKIGGKNIDGGTSTGETLDFRNNSVDNLGFTILSDGILRSNVSNYETLVLNDDDIPNKKYVDDAISVENLWDRVTGGTNYLKTYFSGDELGATGDRIPTIWLDDIKSTAGNIANVSFSAAGIDFTSAALVKTMTLDSTNISSYDAHPVFTLDTQVIDKKYVDDQISAAGIVTKDLTLQLDSGGVTAFTLDTTPANPNIASLFYNGNRQIYGVNFTISGTTLTWINTSPSFILGANDGINHLWIEYEKIIAPINSSIPFRVSVNPAISNATGDNTEYTILYQNVIKDPGAIYNSGTGRITFPSDGIVQVNSTNFTVYTASSHGVFDFRFVLRNSGGTIIDNKDGLFIDPSYVREKSSPTAGQLKITMSALFDVSAGDTLETILKIGATPKNVTIQTNSTFSGLFIPNL